MPRSEAANQRVREMQRARIIEGATTVFAERGLAATMGDVAAAAGISQGLAYRYFSSKEELVRAVVAGAVRAAPGADPQIESRATPGQRLETLIGKLVEARRTQGKFFQLIHHVASDPETPPDLVALMVKRGSLFARTLRRLIVDAQATGEAAADDPDELVTAVIACLDGLTRLPQTHPDGRRMRFPGPEIILRLLKPPAHKENA